MMLMLVGHVLRLEGEEAPDGITVVAIRFFESEDGCERVLRLGKAQARKRHPNVDPETVAWDVYEPKSKPNGWPKWLGPASYYM